MIEFDKEKLMNLNEDFGIGVGAPLGADQGIPLGGDCKAVVPVRMFGLQRRFRLKKKKKKKRVIRESLESVSYSILAKRFKIAFGDDINKYIKNTANDPNDWISFHLDEIEDNIGLDHFEEFLSKNRWYNTSSKLDLSLNTLNIRRGDLSPQKSLLKMSLPYYHVSPANPDVLMKVGLRPKSSNNQENYPARIYLISGDLVLNYMIENDEIDATQDEDEIEWHVRQRCREIAKELIRMLADAAGISERKYKIYKVRLPEQIKVYKDPAYSDFGVYTTSAIPAKYIRA